MDQGGDTYQEGARQVDEQRRGVLPTLPHLRQPVRPETERRTAIRQTVPTKAPVETETSTIINTRKPCCRRVSARCRCNFRSIDQEHDK